MSAALRSRDAGEGRASLGDPGCCLGDGAPVSVGGLLPDGCACQRSEIITCRFHFMAERFVGPPKLFAWCGYPGAAQIPKLADRARAREKAAATSKTSKEQHRSVTLLSSCTPRQFLCSSLSIALRLCSATRLSLALNNVPLALVAAARLLTYQLIFTVLSTLSRISIGTENPPEAATIVPSTQTLRPSPARSLSSVPCSSTTPPDPRNVRHLTASLFPALLASPPSPLSISPRRAMCLLCHIISTGGPSRPR